MSAIVPEYLEANQLVHKLRDPEQTSRILILDVRESDFSGGNIRGAVNAPAFQWGDDAFVDALINEKLPGKDSVVVHCMFSAVRGPRCARRLAQRLHLSEVPCRPSVYILRGGFCQFAEQFGREDDNSDLIEGFVKSTWMMHVNNG